MKIRLLSAILTLVIFIGCNNHSIVDNNQSSKMKQMKEMQCNYTIEDTIHQSFIAVDTSNHKKRPIVMIIPEWWGINDYVKNRAIQLAKLGYVAMAVDMYGQGRNANSVEEAMQYSTPFYQSSNFAKNRFDAAIAEVKKIAEADTNQIAAIGYCFGGSMVLNFAKMGADLKGVVSFHGGLKGVSAKKDLLTAKILVCHGQDDQFVPPADVTAFKKELDDMNASYIFKSYSGATHAFSNPDATEWGKKFKLPIAYNAAADSSSWNEMMTFLNAIFK
jgi:dienelactone hydrolase